MGIFLTQDWTAPGPVSIICTNFISGSRVKEAKLHQQHHARTMWIRFFGWNGGVMKEAVSSPAFAVQVRARTVVLDSAMLLGQNACLCSFPILITYMDVRRRAHGIGVFCSLDFIAIRDTRRSMRKSFFRNRIPKQMRPQILQPDQRCAIHAIQLCVRLKTSTEACLSRTLK